MKMHGTAMGKVLIELAPPPHGFGTTTASAKQIFQEWRGISNILGAQKGETMNIVIV